MKRYLIIIALAMMPVCGFAGVDGHRFGVGLKSSVPVVENQLVSFGVEGFYEMDLDDFVLGAGVGVGPEYHHDWLYANIVAPVFLRAGYEISDNFLISANAGYKINIDGWCLGDGGGSDNPRYTGFFCEPQIAYQTDSGFRFSLGAELYDGVYTEYKTTGRLFEGSFSSTVRDVRSLCAAITFGIGFVFGE